MRVWSCKIILYGSWGKGLFSSYSFICAQYYLQKMIRHFLHHVLFSFLFWFLFFFDYFYLITCSPLLLLCLKSKVYFLMQFLIPNQCPTFKVPFMAEAYPLITNSEIFNENSWKQLLFMCPNFYDAYTSP